MSITAPIKILRDCINYKIRVYTLNPKNKITGKLIFIYKNFNVKIYANPHPEILKTKDIKDIRKEKKADIKFIKIPEALINSPCLLEIKKKALFFI